MALEILRRLRHRSLQYGYTIPDPQTTKWAKRAVQCSRYLAEEKLALARLTAKRRQEYRRSRHA